MSIRAECGRLASGSKGGFRRKPGRLTRVSMTALLAVAFSLLGVRPSRAAIPASERNALIALYRSTNGDWWSNREGWLSDKRHEPAPAGTECEWFGVSCDRDELHVTELVLDRNNLVGRLPAQIGALRHLRRLSLAKNRLAGRLPVSLWTLRDLETLDLSANRLTGSLSARIGALRRLESLSLFSNHLTGPIPADLGRCLAVTEISLADNGLSGPLPPELATLTSLEDLDLSGNRLRSPLPASWGRLQHLDHLNLATNDLWGRIPGGWSRLRSVRSLVLKNNRISGRLPEWLFALPKLSELDLSSNRIAAMWKLPSGDVGESLTSIDLSENAMTGSIPPDIDRLDRLRFLNLRQNRFGGELPPSLFSRSFELLNVSRNQLSGELPRTLELATITDLSGNSFGGSIAASVDATSLRVLSLAHNRFTGDIPMAILASAARSLDLSDNAFSGSLPPGLEIDSDLRVLNLSGNSLTGVIPPGVFAGESLLWVDLSRNRLTGPLPPTSPARALQVLRLAGNQLSGPLPVGSDTTPWLAWLSVEGNRFTGGLNAIAELRSLVAFNGDRNPWMDAGTRVPALPKVPPPDFVVVRASTLVQDSNETASGARTDRRPDADTSAGTRSGGVSLIRAAFVQSQNQTFAIQGAVVDPAGAVIAGATVTATGPNGEIAVGLTEGSGQFRIPVSAPGVYRVRVELSGFSAVEKSVNVTAGQSQSLTFTMQVGSLTETVTVSAEALAPPRPWWNAWVSEPEREDDAPAALAPGRAYQYLLELGSGSVRRANGRSTQIGDRLADEIARLLRDGRPTLSLTVRLLVIGRSIKVSPQPDSMSEWREGRWEPAHREPNMGVLRVDLRRIARADETPQLGEGLLRNERYGAIRLNIEAVQSGCSAIAASIWDEAQTAPLDQLVQIIPVGDRSSCEEYEGQSNQASDPFGIEPYYSRAAATLHLFEFTLGGTPTAVALFAVRGPSAGCPIYAWQLAGTVSGAVFQDTFRQLLTRARLGDATGGYAPVATLVRDVFFRGTTQIKGCGAKAALTALQAAAAQRDIDVLMRVVDRFGRHIFPPLGLISLAHDANGKRLFTNRITPVEPLPSQSLGPPKCVDDWRFVLPEMLDDSPGAIELPDVLAREDDVIRSKKGFETYLDQISEPGPRGLVLLAHYSEGYLTFESPDSVIGFQAISEATFGAGSIAVLSACTAAAITDSSLLVNTLNKAGVDSFIMSPFEIDLSFGVALAKNVSAQIVKAGDDDEPQTLGQLYRTALRATEMELASKGDKVEGWALEYVLAGNPDVPICHKRRAPARNARAEHRERRSR